ncbi:MAG: DNA repair protein RadA [Candidatus Marinimicrobia bacterium]|nr:DNA repair protein RadA [Candidatus Neomarinimicrobiota bacterium]
MAKDKTIYYCTECGSTQLKWAGKCPDCGAWNSMEERKVSKKSRKVKIGSKSTPRPLKANRQKKLKRITTRIDEFDRVLGGGFVTGSVLLLGGEPGVGKSTLMLQILDRIKDKECIYFSGEESEEQIRMRADRLQIQNGEILLSCENSMEKIMHFMDKMNPDIVVIDSIQTIYSEQLTNIPGSITQVKECSGQLTRKAKEIGCITIFVGHITKSGNIAGPKVMEHLVDTVLYLEGGENNLYRVLRSMKNRFGSTNEVGIFSMDESGLNPVKNPSSFFLSERNSDAPGTAIAVSMEGTRPFLIEIQALVTASSYGNPQRTAHGIGYKRLAMLIAVLEKRAGYQMGTQDVFVNIVGGMKIDETAINLSLVAAMASSFRDVSLPSDSAFIGEVGLVGEVRSVPFIKQRVKEASKFGYKNIYLPQKNVKNLNVEGVILTGVNSIEHFFNLVF